MNDSDDKSGDIQKCPPDTMVGVSLSLIPPAHVMGASLDYQHTHSDHSHLCSQVLSAALPGVRSAEWALGCPAVGAGQCIPGPTEPRCSLPSP
jgi:hypothetical protein